MSPRIEAKTQHPHAALPKVSFVEGRSDIAEELLPVISAGALGVGHSDSIDACQSGSIRGSQPPGFAPAFQLTGEAQVVDRVCHVQQGPTSATRSVEVLVDAALTQSDPKKALRIISNGYAAAPPELRNLIVNDASVRFLIAQAVEEAIALLAKKAEGSAPPQQRADEAVEHLHQIVGRLDRKLAAIVAEEAMPSFREFYKSKLGQLPEGVGFSPQGLSACLAFSVNRWHARRKSCNRRLRDLECMERTHCPRCHRKWYW
jgi:hypothetical protein